MKVKKDVSEPSAQKIKEHYVAHVPFRSWCPHCVKGKAKGGFHMKQNKEGHDIPTISMDYFYLIKSENEEDTVFSAVEHWIKVA